MTLTGATLALAVTGCTPSRADQWAPCINEASALYHIDTPARMADFLAQIGHESNGLLWLVELWGPKQVPEQVTYERDPLQPWGPQLQRGDRNFKAYGLGNSQPGDGFRFRGRGPIQRTGRANAAELRDNLRRLGIDCPDFEADPGLMEMPRWGALGAGDFWNTRKLNDFSDDGSDDAFVTQTRRINGGTNGLADRQARRVRARRALGVSS